MHEEETNNKIGDAQLRIAFEFLSRILTTRSIEEESLNHDQYIKVKEINEVNNEDGTLILDCSIYQHTYN